MLTRIIGIGQRQHNYTREMAGQNCN